MAGEATGIHSHQVRGQLRCHHSRRHHHQGNHSITGIRHVTGVTQFFVFCFDYCCVHTHYICRFQAHHGCQSLFFIYYIFVLACTHTPSAGFRHITGVNLYFITVKTNNLVRRPTLKFTAHILPYLIELGS